MDSFFTHSQGLTAGVIASCSLLMIMMIGAQINNVAKDPTLPIQTDECPSSLM